MFGIIEMTYFSLFAAVIARVKIIEIEEAFKSKSPKQA